MSWSLLLCCRRESTKFETAAASAIKIIEIGSNPSILLHLDPAVHAHFALPIEGQAAIGRIGSHSRAGEKLGRQTSANASWQPGSGATSADSAIRALRLHARTPRVRLAICSHRVSPRSGALTQLRSEVALGGFGIESGTRSPAPGHCAGCRTSSTEHATCIQCVGNPCHHRARPWHQPGLLELAESRHDKWPCIGRRRSSVAGAMTNLTRKRKEFEPRARLAVSQRCLTCTGHQARTIRAWP